LEEVLELGGIAGEAKEVEGEEEAKGSVDEKGLCCWEGEAVVGKNLRGSTLTGMRLCAWEERGPVEVMQRLKNCPSRSETRIRLDTILKIK
jgi:hypothetical protein